MIIPSFLIQVALIVIVVRSAYRTIKLVQSHSKPWLDILFHASVALVAFSFLL
jgi:hypothetical protein